MTEQEQIDNIGSLELQDQEWAGVDLCEIVDDAIGGKRKSQNYLKKLWPNCSWYTIKKRIMTEGSAWYVFWMDGMNQHLENLRHYKV